MALGESMPDEPARMSGSREDTRIIETAGDIWGTTAS